MAIELERLAGEGGPDAEPRRSARGGPPPLHPGIDRLLHLPDRRIGPHQPQPGRRAHGRQVGELGEVEACSLIAGQLREGRGGAVGERDLQTVGRRRIEAVERDQAAGARLILDDDGRCERPGKVGRDQPREDVVASADAGAHDHPHSLTGVKGFLGVVRPPRRCGGGPTQRKRQKEKPTSRDHSLHLPRVTLLSQPPPVASRHTVDRGWPGQAWPK
jgi:hypothetical protein